MEPSPPSQSVAERSATRLTCTISEADAPLPAPVGHALRRVSCSMCFCDASQGISGNVQRKISAVGQAYIAVVRVAIWAHRDCHATRVVRACGGYCCRASALPNQITEACGSIGLA
jgi:hypothetical protein